MDIIGIILGTIAIGLFIWLKNNQQTSNDLTDSDVTAMENCHKALMEDFTNYQVETDRKITELEKELKYQNNKFNRRIDKINKELPSIIKKIIGHIEFAKPMNR